MLGSASVFYSCTMVQAVQSFGSPSCRRLGHRGDHFPYSLSPLSRSDVLIHTVGYAPCRNLPCDRCPSGCSTTTGSDANTFQRLLRTARKKRVGSLPSRLGPTDPARHVYSWRRFQRRKQRAAQSTRLAGIASGRHFRCCDQLSLRPSGSSTSGTPGLPASFAVLAFKWTEMEYRQVTDRRLRQFSRGSALHVLGFPR